MSDSTSLLDTIPTGVAQPEVPANELFNAASLAMTYALRSHTALTWNYYGGRVNGTAVANGNVSLTASNDNYIVAHRTTLAVSVSTATTNWNDSGTYGRVYKVVAGTATVTSYEDHRFSNDGSGIFDISGATSGGITALTGDVTASGPGSAAATIANDAVTNAKLAEVGTATFKGRTTAGTGNPEDLTAQQAAAILAPYVGSGGSSGSGVIDLHAGKVYLWHASGASTTPYTFGGESNFNSSPSVTGTASTSLYTQTQRLRHTSGSTAGSSQGHRGTANSAIMWRGNAAGLGGFRFSCVFGVATPQANMRILAGLISSSAAIGNVEPSSLTNIFCMAADAGEANFSIMHNDGTGTATKIALGANYPVQTTETDLYRITISCSPNGSSMEYRVERLNTGDDTGTVSVSTDLPTNTTFPLFWQCWINNGATAAAVSIDIARVAVTLGH